MLNNTQPKYNILTNIIATIFFTIPIILIGILKNFYWIYIYSFIINFILLNFITTNMSNNIKLIENKGKI